jgi:hypothetical protein
MRQVSRDKITEVRMGYFGPGPDAPEGDLQFMVTHLHAFAVKRS